MADVYPFATYINTFYIIMKTTNNTGVTFYLLLFLLLLTGGAVSLHAQTQLTGSWTALDKVYDGTAAATVTFTPDNITAGDDVTVTITANFRNATNTADDANAGDAAKPIAVTNIVLDGSNAGNYSQPAVPDATTLTAKIMRYCIDKKEYNAGQAHKFEPQQAGYYLLEVYGGQGADGTEERGAGGGYSKGIVYLEKGDVLYLFVGGRGEATDMRINDTSLNHRIIVAGGGGSSGTIYGVGGAGGGAAGGDGSNGSTGGTQSGGGTGSGTGDATSTTNPSPNGIFGYGGKITDGLNGGDGWYGGGAQQIDTYQHGSAGGSGWVYTASTYNNWQINNSTDAQNYAVNEKYYLLDASTEQGHKPDGNSTIHNPPQEGTGPEKRLGEGFARISTIEVTFAGTNPVYTGLAVLPTGAQITINAYRRQNGQIEKLPLTTSDYTLTGSNNIDAGQNTATLNIIGQSNYQCTYDGIKFSIDKKQLTATWAVKKKVVGATNLQAVITPTLSGRGSGQTTTDVDIDASSYQGTFDNTNTIGQHPVTLSFTGGSTAFTLTGTKAANYLPPALPTGVTGIVASTTFTGNTNSTWSERRNWETTSPGGESSNGSIDITPPNRADLHPNDNSAINITIEKNCVQNVAVDVHSITVEAGASYTVNTGNTLTTDDFTLMDNASFLRYGAATITTAHVKHTLAAGRNWYVGSPMQGGTTAPTAGASFGKKADGSDVTSGRIHCWDDTAYDWQQLAADDKLTTGLGYTAYSQSEDIGATFSGEFTDGDQQSPTLYRTEGRLKPGYNLVANPFPSYWKWTATAAAQAGAKPTIWYRTVESSGTYQFYTYNAASNTSAPDQTINPKDYVPPMQAFWVQLNEHVTGSSFTFANANRSHAATPGNNTLKSAPSDDRRTLLRIVVADASGRDCDEAVVYADPAAQSGFDDYDSEKMMNGTGGELYSLPQTGAEHLVINGLPTIENRTAVTLGFVSDRAAGYTLRAVDFTAADRLTVDLYDLRSGHAETNWQAHADGYRFDAAAKDDPARFRLVFRTKAGGATTSTEQQQEALIQQGQPTLRVYAGADRRLIVENGHGHELSVYTLTGSAQGRYRINTDTWTSPLPAFGRGIYIVRIKDTSFKIAFL